MYNMCVRVLHHTYTHHTWSLATRSIERRHRSRTDIFMCRIKCRTKQLKRKKMERKKNIYNKIMKWVISFSRTQRKLNRSLHAVRAGSVWGARVSSSAVAGFKSHFLCVNFSCDSLSEFQSVSLRHFSTKLFRFMFCARGDWSMNEA